MFNFAPGPIAPALGPAPPRKAAKPPVPAPPVHAAPPPPPPRKREAAAEPEPRPAARSRGLMGGPFAGLGLNPFFGRAPGDKPEAWSGAQADDKQTTTRTRAARLKDNKLVGTGTRTTVDERDPKKKVTAVSTRENHAGYDAEKDDVTAGLGSEETRTEVGPDGKEKVASRKRRLGGAVDRKLDGGSVRYERRDKQADDVDETGFSTGGGVDLGDQTATVSGGRTRGGRTTEGSLTVGKDGDVSGSGSVTGKRYGAGASFDSKDGVDELGLEASAGGNKLGVKAGRTDKRTQAVGEEDDGTVASQLLSGEAYLSTTREDGRHAGGSISVKDVGLSGDVRSGSILQSFALLPKNWDKLPKEKQQQYKDRQKAAQKKLGGLGDVDLDHLQEGTGVRFKSYNGWDAGAGLSYGAVSGSFSQGKASSHEVALARKDGKIVVSMTRQDGVSAEAGLKAFGSVGLGASSEEQDTRRFDFHVDPKKPEAMAAMQQYLQTGLLPGADRGKDQKTKKAAQRFEAARADVTSQTKQLARLREQEKKLREGDAADPTDPQLLGLQEQQRSLGRELAQAQHTLATTRDSLNDGWEASSQAGDSPMPGVTVDKLTDAHAKKDRQSVDLLGIKAELGGTDREWMHQQYIRDSRVEDSYGYHQTDYGFRGKKQSEHGTETSTAQSGTVWTMYSDDRVGSTRELLRQIDKKDVPDYVLADPNFRIKGRMSVEIDAKQVQGIADSLNDVRNPQAMKMWQDAGKRVGNFVKGDKWWADQQAGKDGDGPRQSAVDAINRERERSMHEPRMDYINDKLRDAKEGKAPWDKLPELKSGNLGGFESLQRTMAGVKGPKDFQGLDDAHKLAFIRLMQDTSGNKLDPDGTANPYEALAPIGLLKDEKLKAQERSHSFENANAKGQSQGMDRSNGTAEFVDFTQRFKGDKQIFGQLQTGISFEWEQDRVNEYTKKSGKDLQHELKSAFDARSGAPWDRHHNPDENKALDVLQAVYRKEGNAEKGGAALNRAIRESGVDVMQMYRQMSDEGTRQHLFYDLLRETEYADAVRAEKDRSFPLPCEE